MTTPDDPIGVAVTASPTAAIQAAVTQFMTEHAPALFRTLKRHGASPEVANDIIQDTYLVMCQRWPHLRDYRNRRPYMYRVAINRLRDEHKKSLRESAIPQLADSLILVPDFTVAAAQRMDLRAAILKLEDIEQVVIELYYYLGFSVREIAHIICVKEHTVTNGLHRARRKLQPLLKSHSAQEGESE